MKKLSSLVILLIGFLIACEDHESAKQVSAEDLSKNSTFISIMKENQAAINRFTTYINSSNLPVEDIMGWFANQVKTETDYSKLIIYLGYKSIVEFESVYSELNIKYNLLLESYPELKDDNKLKVIFKEATSLYLIENELIYDQQYLGRKREGAKKKPGCSGGVACIRTATLCNNEAQIDFAVTSAACNSLGFNPVGWAFCQAGANITYTADIIVCDYDLDNCCRLD